MNSFSKSHKRFSERLHNHRVLTNPEEFLGPNYKAVIDFWLILDGLSKDQWKTIRSRYWDFYNNQFSEWDKSFDEAIKASIESIGEEFAIKAANAALDVYGVSAAYSVTYEIIGLYKLFEQQKPLTFFQMFLDSYEHNF